MIRLDDIDYAACLWFLEGPFGNVLAIVYRDREGKWVGVYRFRHFGPLHGKGPFDPFEDDDRKSFYTIVSNRPPAEQESHLVESMDDALGKLALIGYGRTLQKLPVNGDGKATLAVLTKQSWCHMKWGDKDEKTHPVAGSSDGAARDPDDARRARNRRKAERAGRR